MGGGGGGLKGLKGEALPVAIQEKKGSVRGVQGWPTQLHSRECHLGQAKVNMYSQYEQSTSTLAMEATGSSKAKPANHS